MSLTLKLLSMLLLGVSVGLAADQTVYIGTRTRDGRSEGIYRMSFDSQTGTLRDVKLSAKTVDPSFLALSTTKPLLFSVMASPEGMVKSFAIEADGGLRLLNAVSSKGAGPAHVQVDRTGKWLAVANYNSGSMAVHRIEADGKLSEAVDWRQHEGSSVDAARQKEPHAHSVNFSADNKHLYVADLGIDEVKVYAFDASTGKLAEGFRLMSPKGGGPRHLVLGKKRVYVLNEMGSSVSVYEGTTLIETVNALPAGFSGVSTAAEVLLDKSEKFLYASNRGADTIAVFRVGEKLTKVADTKVGKVPRGFVFSTDGKFLLVASQDDNTIQSYRVDAQTGLLTAVGEAVKAGSPICLRFARSGS